MNRDCLIGLISGIMITIAFVFMFVPASEMAFNIIVLGLGICVGAYITDTQRFKNCKEVNK